ncbi:MAG TPA: cell division protein ZapA [Clostridiales bacterium]|nr:cell division protein ZapA [Clostridiales bacterium]
MAEQKKLAVTVGGQSFYLKSDQDEAYLKNLAETIDHKISAMRGENPALTVVKAAVLISMELLDEYRKLEEDYENFRSEVAKLEF